MSAKGEKVNGNGNGKCFYPRTEEGWARLMVHLNLIDERTRKIGRIGEIERKTDRIIDALGDKDGGLVHEIRKNDTKIDELENKVIELSVKLNSRTKQAVGATAGGAVAGLVALVTTLAMILM